MRLIDADRCWDYFYEHLTDDGMVGAMNAIEEMQTVDAVPVVRCKDCKFNYANQIPSDDVCELCVELPISKEFYCAYGEPEK